MLTDPVDDRKTREAAMKSWYWGYLPLGSPIAPTATQDREIPLLSSDSARLKTTAPKGERMAY